METGRPDKVCGIHFFNPAPVMSLVEVVRPITASDDTIAAAKAFAEACGKTPVEVKDQAGFIVNALLFPYLNNAVRLLENGVATRDDIDTAMKGGCGFPMGPFALLDLVGLDTSLAILDALYERVPRPQLRGRPAAAPDGGGRALRPEVGPGLLRLPQVSVPARGRDGRAARSTGRGGRVPAGAGGEWRGERRGASGPRPGQALGDAHLLGPHLGPGLEPALPDQPGQGPDRAVDRLRPPHPDRVRPRRARGRRRGGQGGRPRGPPGPHGRALRRASPSGR